MRGNRVLSYLTVLAGRSVKVVLLCSFGVTGLSNGLAVIRLVQMDRLVVIAEYSCVFELVALVRTCIGVFGIAFLLELYDYDCYLILE